MLIEHSDCSAFASLSPLRRGSCEDPAAFPSLPGLTRTEFDALAEQFETELRSAATTRREGKVRSRARAGHPYRPRGRLRMAPLGLRIDPTYAVWAAASARTSGTPYSPPAPHSKSSTHSAAVRAAFAPGQPFTQRRPAIGETA